MSFAFERAEGHIGVPLHSQLVLVSHAHAFSQPVTIHRIRILFEGGFQSIELRHDDGEALNDENKTSNPQFQDVKLGKKAPTDDVLPLSPTSPDSHLTLTGCASLSIAAGYTKVLCFSDIPRTAGEVEVSSVTLLIHEKDFDLELLITEDEDMQQNAFLIPLDRGIAPRQFSRRRSNAINILPKPPKLRLELTGLGRECFIDEELNLIVDIVNDEEEDVEVVLDARLVEPSEIAPQISWGDDQQSDNLPKSAISLKQNEVQKSLGRLTPSISKRRKLRILATSRPADYTLEIRAQYCLESDRETIVIKSAYTHLSLHQPFEATTTFMPIVHPDAWPIYFAVDDKPDSSESNIGESNPPEGLVQRWSATVRITSLAASPIKFEGVEVLVDAVREAAACSVSGTDHHVSRYLPPAELQERHFSLDVQKIELEDRRSVFLDLRLKLLWLQDGSPGPATTTFVSLPELAVPFGEPRVLASARNEPSPLAVTHLTYTIENPSSYHLSFSITMETSDDFAFSGAKNTTIQLVPMSRRLIQYKLLPLARGKWISPQLQVYDTQFHKMLKIQGTEGMRNEKKGPSIWIDVDG